MSDKLLKYRSKKLVLRCIISDSKNPFSGLKTQPLESIMLKIVQITTYYNPLDATSVLHGVSEGGTVYIYYKAVGETSPTWHPLSTHVGSPHVEPNHGT